MKEKVIVTSALYEHWDIKKENILLFVGVMYILEIQKQWKI